MPYYAPMVVLSEALLLKDNRVYYSGVPFSGIALFSEKGVVTRFQSYTEGETSEEHQFPYQQSPSMGILDDLLDEYWESYRVLEFQGKPYTGYVFVPGPNSLISDIECYVDGKAEEGCCQHFSDSNAYSDLVISKGNIQHTYSWNSPDKLSSYRISAVEQLSSIDDSGAINVYFAGPNNTISTLNIYKNGYQLFDACGYDNDELFSLADLPSLEQYMGTGPLSIELFNVPPEDLGQICKQLSEWSIDEFKISDMTRDCLNTLSQHQMPKVKELVAYNLIDITEAELIEFKEQYFPDANLKC
ncbi:hypothetical protein [Pseudoalteromonas luteoviolacea]|uniref:Uncharacterized protein n=1 Tax=Pseudoalteromonas luteoviolacea (strain 2ta16) TaxID=1353533 RepID=V4HRL6_PSEL2|nr:hypothetical protein [Pseudoalteromonas luteoviolacea]ESP93460.1 hypothetical protein PL2TA16_03313 [Pseudoalteromonas luteoviolacea 2ta16]KZN43934.1 hypothetical protein N483_08415 [Pseudoalteromonas luteoviolacea NCIMB 1944]